MDPVRQWWIGGEGFVGGAVCGERKQGQDGADTGINFR